MMNSGFKVPFELLLSVCYSYKPPQQAVSVNNFLNYWDFARIDKFTKRIVLDFVSAMGYLVLYFFSQMWLIV